MSTKNERLSFLNHTLRHREWRKVAKKSRRKRIRQKNAKERDAKLDEEEKQKQASPSYQKWIEEQRLMEEHQRIEEERQSMEAHAKWLRAEDQAKKDWIILQKKLEFAKEERAKQQALIKVEWEKERKRLKELEEKKRQDLQDKLDHEQFLKQQIEDYIENGGELPEQLHGTLETNPNREPCPFFRKTATCRFGDGCSRNHIRPKVSSSLLIPNFYSHISLTQSETEHGTDSLEFDFLDTYNHFKEFFYDVLPELEKFGRIKFFRVCCNQEPHLRGNVYVEYSHCREAMKAYKIFQGRWYGGKQLNVEFCKVECWASAICGLFFKKSCPKGSACNFLHVFRNPGDFYSHVQDRRERHNDNTNDSRHWRWSESPERLPTYERGYHRNGDHKSQRWSRSPSRSSRQSRSKSPTKSRRHNRSRSKNRKRKRSRSSRQSTLRRE